ncbi:hypothetical protein [Vibrio phage J14]|nr:hypothetical protein [Vibrio phage J14]
MKRRRYMYRKGKTNPIPKRARVRTRAKRCNRDVGSSAARKLVNNQRASAVIHFKLDKDANDEYGLPTLDLLRFAA